MRRDFDRDIRRFIRDKEIIGDYRYYGNIRQESMVNRKKVETWKVPDLYYRELWSV